MVNQQLRRFGAKFNANSMNTFGRKTLDTVRRFGSKITHGVNRLGDFSQHALPIAESALSLIPGGRDAVPMIRKAADLFSRVQTGVNKANKLIQG